MTRSLEARAGTTVGPPIISPNATTTRIAGWAAIAAPLLLLGSTVAFLTHGDGINDGFVGGTIGVWSALAFMLAFVGIFRVLEFRAPRAAPIWLSITLMGWAAGVGFNVDAILAAEFGRETVDTAIEDRPFTLLAFVPWGWMAPLGVVAAGVLMRRTNTFGRVSGLLTVAAGVLFIASRPARIGPLAIFADCIAVLALVPIGWALLAISRTASDAREEA